MQPPTQSPVKWSLLDVLLFVVTFGFYMPFWFWWNNRVLVRTFTRVRMMGNGPFLSVGGLMATFFRGSFGVEDPAMAAYGSMLGIVIFLTGVFLFARNLRLAAEDLAEDPPVTGWLFVGALGIGFLGTEVGHLVPSWLLRAPVLLVLVGSVYLFYRLHVDLSRLDAELPGGLKYQSPDARREGPPGPPSLPAVLNAPPTYRKG